jgi:CubicO group peptidase (beta-lactamase class C family)
VKRLLRPVVVLFVSLAIVPVGVATLVSTGTALFAAENGARDLSKATPESVGISPERLIRLDQGLRKFIDENRLAGVTTLLARHGRIVHTDSYGKKDIRRADPIQRDSIFRIYSMTKPVTGVAMMMLYEEGKWRLDDPVSRYIPEFAKLQVYAGDNPDGSMRTEDARRSMTMRELMTHSAGLGYVLSQTHPVDRMIISQRVLDPSAPLQAMIEKLARVPLLTQPGTRWSYSIAVDVQGYLVEKLSGKPFAEFLKTRLLDPLGMKDTGFYVPKAKLGRMAMVHSDGPGGTLAPPAENPETFTVPPAGASGGGGLFSTSDDYLRFAQMLLNGGEFAGVRYLSPRTVEMMRTNHLQAEALKTMRPGTGWGLDFRVVIDAAAAGEPTSDGTFDWFGIAGTWFWIDPKADLVFVGMIQSRGRANNEIQGISRNLVYQSLLN